MVIILMIFFLIFNLMSNNYYKGAKMNRLFLLLVFCVGFISSLKNAGVQSENKGLAMSTGCPNCESSKSEMEGYIKKLEATIKALHDDVARWMKLYADEIASKANGLEKAISYYVDTLTKILNLELRMNSALNVQKKSPC